MSEEAIEQAPEAVEATEAVPATDTPAAPPPQEPVKTAEDRSWAAVQRHETKLREDRERFKRDRSEFEKSKADAAQLQEQLKVLQGGLRDDPLKFLKDNGIPFDDLAKRVLNEGSASPEELIRKNRDANKTEIEQLREQVATLQTQQSDRENERMIREYQSNITKTLDADEFELLRAYPDAADMVFEVASRYAAENGEVLTASDAARRIQGEMREKLTALASNQAVKALLGLQEASTESPPPENEEQSKPVGGINTLTNTLAATPAVETTSYDGSSALSTYEMLRQAAQLVKD